MFGRKMYGPALESCVEVGEVDHHNGAEFSKKRFGSSLHTPSEEFTRHTKDAVIMVPAVRKMSRRAFGAPR